MVRNLMRAHRELVVYLFFGGLTTLVNFIGFAVAEWLGLGTFWSVTIAWVLAVTFAYVTNRRWVFLSKVKGTKNVLNEAGQFFSLRAGTYFLDLGIVWYFVEYLGFDERMQQWLVKLCATVLVVIANFLLSKFIVFRKR